MYIYVINIGVYYFKFVFIKKWYIFVYRWIVLLECNESLNNGNNEKYFVDLS